MEFLFGKDLTSYVMKTNWVGYDSSNYLQDYKKNLEHACMKIDNKIVALEVAKEIFEENNITFDAKQFDNVIENNKRESEKILNAMQDFEEEVICKRQQCKHDWIADGYDIVNAYHCDLCGEERNAYS